MERIVRIDNRELKNDDILKMFVEKVNADGLDIKIETCNLEHGDIECIEIENGIVVKHVVIERKTLEDLIASIEDDRTITQYEGMLDKIRETGILRAFTILVGTDWERVILKHSYYKVKKMSYGSYETAMVEILSKYSTSGLNVIQVPSTGALVKLCFKLFERNLDDVIRHVITVDRTNKKYEDYVRSLECLVKGLGIKVAEKIALDYPCYEDVINATPVEISNKVRVRSGHKQTKKAIPSVEKLWNKCKRIKK